MRHIGDINPDESGGYVEEPRRPATPTTKPTREHCRRQLSRLNSKFGAPRGEEDAYRLKQVLDVLQSASESDTHVTRVIDRMEELDRFPDGYTLRQAAYETRTREKQPDPACTKCAFGWVQVGITYEFGGRKVDTTATKKCDCWREVEL